MRPACWLLPAALLLGWPALADEPAKDPPAASPHVSVTFDGVPVHDAIAQLAEQTGVDIIVADGVQGRVIARFTDQPLDTVLQVIALALGATVEKIETLYVLKPAPAPGQSAPPAMEGAGALLPGVIPTAPLQEAGGATAPAVAAPPAPRPAETTQAAPPADGTRPAATAPDTGAGQLIDPRHEGMGTVRGGYVDAHGVYHGATAPDGVAARPGVYQDLLQHLPPGARVSRNGTIMLPGGNIVLPSDTVITHDGHVYQPSLTPTLTVPGGMPLPQGGNQATQQQGTLSGNLFGVPFATGNGQLTLQPPTINLGGLGQLQLPGVTLGSPQVTGLPQSTLPPELQPRVYYGAHPPNVHFGEMPPNWYYTTPDGWHYTGPSTLNGFYPGFTPPRGMGGSLPRAGSGGATADPNQR